MLKTIIRNVITRRYSTVLLDCNKVYKNQFSIFILQKNDKLFLGRNYYSSRLRFGKPQLFVQTLHTRRQPKRGDDEDDIKQLFPSPKSILHNAFDAAAAQLNDTTLRVHPTFEKDKNLQWWHCTYNLKWPENKKITSAARTKQEASNKSALATLLWLLKQGKISKKGQLKIYDDTVTKEQLKQRHVLNLKDTSKDIIRDIIGRHEQIKDLITFESIQDSERNIEVQSFYKGAQRNILPPFRYEAQEKIVLPISAYKEEFIQKLRENNALIVQGEPGCGKSTRIPQYVLESWLREGGYHHRQKCRIIVTQPRRIAAISLAQRVSDERDEMIGTIVGYKVRLRNVFNRNTGKILYCTTGVVLNHLQQDPNLDDFTHIILDEAHERDVNTDLILNVLRKIQRNNKDLKIIIMSATIETNLFKEYFNADVMHVPGRTFPVKSYFLDQLPIKLPKTEQLSNSEPDTTLMLNHREIANFLLHLHHRKPPGGILCFLPGWDDIIKIKNSIPQSDNLMIMCLHSRVQDSEQQAVFAPPPPGKRKIILATNIAETSVTVNDIVYVVDTGIHKENRFDAEKGIDCMDNYWISKSNMKQRRGRAGRVQPGESYHLYTHNKFDSFEEHPQPEILRTSLSKIVLDAKVYSNNMKTLDFMKELPSPPGDYQVEQALTELKELELLDENENLTSLGRTLSNFQMEPKYAKALINSSVYKCVTPVADILSLYTTQTELFTNNLYLKDEIIKTKELFNDKSDHIALMKLFENWLFSHERQDYEQTQSICSNFHLSPHRMVLMKQLRELTFGYLFGNLPRNVATDDTFSDNEELIKGVLLSGVGNLLIHRDFDVVKGRVKKTKSFITCKGHRAAITSDSVNYKKKKYDSDFLIYLNETRSNIRRTTLIRETTQISPLSLILFWSKPIKIERIKDDENNVKLTLEDTKVGFICNKETAEDLVKCREALRALYQYYIHLLTVRGAEPNSSVTENWDSILENLNNLLLENSL